MTEDQIRRTILASPFAAHVETLMAGGQPALRLHAERIALDELALGASRLGGVPDLPPGTIWPCNGEWPLEMIAQINLSDAAGCFHLPDLPANGWLVFFYEDHKFTPFTRSRPEGWRPCQIIYFDGAVDGLVRLDPPPRPPRKRGWIGRLLFGPPKPHLHYEPCTIRLERKFQLVHDEDEEASDRADVGGEDEARWLAHEKMWESIGHWSLGDRSGEPRHSLRGNASPIQGPMRREAEETARDLGLLETGGDSAEERQSDWELLLEIDSDEDGPGWMWGDVGRLYFWIRRQDLAVRDFSKVSSIEQCH